MTKQELIEKRDALKKKARTLDIFLAAYCNHHALGRGAGGGAVKPLALLSVFLIIGCGESAAHRLENRVENVHCSKEQLELVIKFLDSCNGSASGYLRSYCTDLAMVSLCDERSAGAEK